MYKKILEYMINKNKLIEKEYYDIVNKYNNIITKEKYIMFINLETIRLPSLIDKNRSTRILRICFSLCGENGVASEMHKYIIKPYGYHIPNYLIKYHHITNEIAMKDGIAFGDFVQIIEMKIRNIKKIVTNNIDILIRELENISMIETANIIRMVPIEITNTVGTKLCTDSDQRLNKN